VSTLPRPRRSTCANCGTAFRARPLVYLTEELRNGHLSWLAHTVMLCPACKVAQEHGMGVEPPTMDEVAEATEWAARDEQPAS
jgi:hypothetical protein